MPLNCPKHYSEYNACLECGCKHGKECVRFTPTPIVEKLSDILTLEERISLLEDKDSPQIVEHIHRTSDMSKQEFALLHQTSGLAKYLNKLIENHLKPSGQGGDTTPL